MPVPVELTPHAALDLEDIAAHIARDDAVAAERWVARLVDRAVRVGGQPRSGRMVPEYGDPDVREVFLGAYRIIYKVEPTRVLILKFIEGHHRLRRR